MASTPGLFTEWPWKRLGNFKVGILIHSHFLLLLGFDLVSFCCIDVGFIFVKYVLLAPLLVHTVYSTMKKKEKGEDLDLFEISIIPMQILRVIHTQFWITLSRIQTGKSTNNRIVSKSLEFEQVDRERNW